jgi:hypothetical protein
MTTPNINDGGPAFPGTRYLNDDVPLYVPGMTLRDWFIGNSHQPGITDAHLLAGCPEIPPPSGFTYESWAACSIDYKASRWWEGLPLAERYRLYGELRVLAADAMLAARNKDPAQ